MGGLWRDNSGYTVGEEDEQVFSYMSRTGTTTKHMSPERMLDFLLLLIPAVVKNVARLQIKFYLILISEMLGTNHFEDIYKLFAVCFMVWGITRNGSFLNLVFLRTRSLVWICSFLLTLFSVSRHMVRKHCYLRPPYSTNAFQLAIQRFFRVNFALW